MAITLTERLREVEGTVLDLISRWSFLRELEKKLGEQAVGGQVMVKNDIIYRLASDSYEMFVINLASFAKAALQRGGFLNQLNNHLSELRRRRIPLGENGDRYLQKEYQESIDIAFGRLFPEAENDRPQQDDVKKLKDRWEAVTKRAVAVRDDVHAHRYEGKTDLTGVQFFSIQEAEQCFEALERILNDIRLLCDFSTFSYHSMNYSDEEETAKDIRELILHDSFNWFFRKLGLHEEISDPPHYWKRRNDYYESQKWAEEKEGWCFDE